MKESARFIFEAMAILKDETGSWCDSAGKKELPEKLRTPAALVIGVGSWELIGSQSLVISHSAFSVWSR
jgi:hypothetical protein